MTPSSQSTLHTPITKQNLLGRVAPAVCLLFLAPLVAEFLLGNLPIKLLPALVVLAPLYGGGALLIRELVRRTDHGWPSIILLGMAYTLVEEGFTTQSLFNPDYLLMKMHLLQPGYISQLGIGAWWTLFMFNLHTVWSIATPIALVEAAVPQRATEPWLGRTGLIVTALLFAAGVIGSTFLTIKKDHSSPRMLNSPPPHPSLLCSRSRPFCFRGCLSPVTPVGSRIHGSPGAWHSRLVPRSCWCHQGWIGGLLSHCWASMGSL
ncbi:MAG TPA: hypothetical protein VGD64_16455 [Acidisarcina sp.]